MIAFKLFKQALSSTHEGNDFLKENGRLLAQKFHRQGSDTHVYIVEVRVFK